MDCLYILKSRFENKNSFGSIVGQKGDILYNCSIEKYVEGNEIHRVLKESFEYCTIKSGHTPLFSLLKYGKIYAESNWKLSDFRLVKIKSKIGGYHPRIHRPFIERKEIHLMSTSRQIEELKQEVFKYPEYFPGDIRLQLSAVNQLGALKSILLDIFKTLHPANKNLKAYGQDIKNLLVLSCIEVETQLKGIYSANETTPKSQYTTRDFVKLNTIMQLNKYEVKFLFYPDLKIISPFRNWTNLQPTKSLKWFDSYNAIKHNSERDFGKATLENAICAFCAVAVLVRAQYGNYIPFWDEKIGQLIETSNKTIWKLDDMIIPPLTKGHWTIEKARI